MPLHDLLLTYSSLAWATLLGSALLAIAWTAERRMPARATPFARDFPRDGSGHPAPERSGDAARPAPPAGEAIFSLIVVAELAWAFVGSLGLGLTGPASAGPVAPWIWLGGAVVIAAAPPLVRLLRHKAALGRGAPVL
ncbi:hypothetical protein [Roseomonas sp. WA12]